MELYDDLCILFCVSVRFSIGVVARAFTLLHCHIGKFHDRLSILVSNAKIMEIMIRG